MMFEILIKISGIALPVFIFLTMLNVGLTQKLKDVVKYLRDRGFGLRMLAANFILAPFFMWVLLRIFPIDIDLRLGLAIFSICAGAPFLVKLTQLSDHNIALGASTMFLLVFATIIIVPLVLPLVMPHLNINGALIAWTLVKQLVFPIVLGVLLVKFLPHFSRWVQPWVAGLGNWALYITIVTTLVGYFPYLKAILGQGALLIGTIFIVGAFGIGYLLGGFSNKDHLRDVGALGTAQKNTAASMVIAAQNFSDRPEVLVVITMVNTLGIALLLGVAVMISRDNKVKIIYPDEQMLQSDI